MPTLKTPEASALALTLEDVAHWADAATEQPKDTARRLRTLVRFGERDQILETFRQIGRHLETLDQMAQDAGVEHASDGLYVFQIFKKLRSEPWEGPEDLLDHRVDVPYQELISMTDAHARRAQGDEEEQLQQLSQRLTAALSEELGQEGFVTQLIDRLIGFGDDTAEETLNQITALYRRRRQTAAG